MAKKKAKNDPGNKLKKPVVSNEKPTGLAAHAQADKDIEKDPDFNTKPHREDDLDEGELARLEGED
ncbi:MAG: hypothetical protein ACXWV2_13275 [Chitinophagaceae bacterium]